jgi:predicted hydrolase (HD superfamily)
MEMYQASGMTKEDVEKNTRIALSVIKEVDEEVSDLKKTTASEKLRSRMVASEAITRRVPRVYYELREAKRNGGMSLDYSGSNLQNNEIGTRLHINGTTSSRRPSTDSGIYPPDE